MVSVSVSIVASLLMQVLFNSVQLAHAGGLRGSPGSVSEADVESSFISEMVGAVSDERLAQLEAAFRVTYASLPKNSNGNLDAQAVRYVLHRMFVQHTGWFIKGLEPYGETFSTVSSLEWVPSHIRNLVEKRLANQGLNLKELAAMAATLETIVHKEAVEKLKMAYSAHGLSTEEPIGYAELQHVLGSYMVEFLEPGQWNISSTNGSTSKAQSFLKAFAAAYSGWPALEDWLGSIEAPHLEVVWNDEFSFAATQKIIEDIGQKFSNFNAGDCHRLKMTLMEMEDKQPGRVRLSEFYNKSLYSHWQFDEKQEYLRQLGALDESDPNNVQVILANYVSARPNCLEASSLYAICCRNECEDLMGSIERDVGAPSATVEEIAKLVAELSSDTVQAPRQLSARLLSRLDQVAAGNGGTVYLHGRLFAQWMHHAFPRECPFPHESGTTKPMSADEWCKATGHESERTSEEELRNHLETAPALQELPSSQDNEDIELHWSDTEELLAMPQQSPPTGSMRMCSRALAGLLLMAVVGMVVHSSYTKRHRGGVIGTDETGPLKPRKNDAGSLGMLVAFCGLSIVVLIFDLFDPSIFVGAMLLGCVPLALQRLVPHSPLKVKNGS